MAYKITWSIDIDDPSIITAHQAAERAQELQQKDRDGYWCGTYEVTDDSTGEITTIDLDRDDDDPVIDAEFDTI